MPDENAATARSSVMSIENEFRIRDWLVQPKLNRISGHGVEHHVEPKVLEVLLCLAESPGTVVSRDELLARVWPDTIVVETTVFRAVSELRRLFGDDPRQPDIIETVRKRGYRLIAPIEQVEPVDFAAEVGVVAPPERPARWSELPLRSSPRVWRLGLLGAVAISCVTAAALQFRVSSVTASYSTPPAWPAPPIMMTSSPKLELFPTLSPDGKSVAFVWAGEVPWKVQVQLEGDTDPRVLNPDSRCERRPAWSPEGTEIALWSETETGDELIVVPVLGGPARALARLPRRAGGALSWSADASRIATSLKPSADEPRSIFLVDVQGETEPRRLTTPPEGWFGDVDPAVSPDGESVAFVRSSVGGHLQDVYLAPIDGGRPRQLTFDKKPVRGLAWRDAEILLFASKRSHQYAIWQLSPATGEISWTGIANARHPAVASEGGYLAYVHGEQDVNIWEADLTGDDVALKPLISTTRIDVSPHFRADGKSIVFSSERTGHFEIWTCDRDGTNCLQRTNFRQFAARPRWSPDGRRIAFEADISGNLDLFVIDTPGQPARRLTQLEASEASPSWSADGRWIYFASESSGTWQLWKIASGGGEPVPVTRGGGLMARESPDRRWLYFTRSTERGLWRMPVQGGAEVLVAKDFPTRKVWSWDFYGDEIVVVKAHRDGAEVMAIDVDSDRKTRLARLPIPATVDWALAPDRRSLLFTRVDRRASDIFQVRLAP